VKDIVMSMALFATGSVGIIFQQCLTMNPSHIVGHLLGMAVAAVYLLQIIGMGKAFIGRIGMAGEAGVAVMDRSGKNGGIHIHGDRSSVEHPSHLSVFMTHHTILVRL
jgi:hypothetical protein